MSVLLPQLRASALCVGCGDSCASVVDMVFDSASSSQGAVIELAFAPRSGRRPRRPVEDPYWRLQRAALQLLPICGILRPRIVMLRSCCERLGGEGTSPNRSLNSPMLLATQVSSSSVRAQ